MRVRTEYSTGYAFGKLEDVFKRMLELETEYMPISDRMSTFGWVEWNELCLKNNKKPIFGVELGVSANPHDKRPSISYMSFFAVNSTKRINDLVALATSQQSACLTYDQIRELPWIITIADNRAKLDMLDPSGPFIALSPSTPIGYYREAKKRGFQFIQSNDNVFATKDDKETYRVMLGRQAYSASYAQFIQSIPEWDKECEYFDGQDRIDAVYNRSLMEKGCTATLPMASLPKIDAPRSLRDMCLEGAAVLLGSRFDSQYISRMDYELDIISKKNFNDYFYIVAELMQWARQRMIVSPGRGSSAGSLVCYLLGITSVDPIKHNLLFERFLDITRKDLPDIDMDFDDTRRDMVFDHLSSLYGEERVAKIANVTRFRPKTIISTAATSLRIPMWLSRKAADELHEYGGVDERSAVSFADSFKFGEFSQKLRNEYPEINLVYNTELHAKNMSVHAAGAVITDGDISTYVAIDNRNHTIMADKNTAERLGLLKLDLLGLSQLGIFARCLELMGTDPTNTFLDQIPLDETEAFEVINRKQYAGIFQMGRALINLFKYFHVKSLEDIVAVTSLARPGPLSSGGATRWVNRRIGVLKTEYAHECLEPFLKSTYGEVVYQEQLMQIAQHIGGMSIEDVAALRKAVAKSKGAEVLRPYGDKFKEGAARFGFDGVPVDKFWDDLCGFGAYSFNRSHAVSYSIITYYCCWFKAFYPVEFAAATLDAETDPDNQIKLLRELHSEGVEYVPIDPIISTDKWAIKIEGDKRILVGPLTSIKGIGPAGLKEIIEARASGQPLKPGLQKKLDEAVTPIDSLTPIETAVKRCIPDLKTMNISSKPVPITSLHAGDRGSYMIIGLLKGLKRKDRNDAESLQRRKGKKITGDSLALNMTMIDDSGGEIVCIIDPKDYQNAAPSILERGGVDKSIYAIKGTIPDNFRMISISNIRYLCNIDDGLKPVGEDYFAAPKEDYFATSKENTNGIEPIQSEAGTSTEEQDGINKNDTDNETINTSASV